MNKAYLDPLEYVYAYKKGIESTETKIDDAADALLNFLLIIPVTYPIFIPIPIFLGKAIEFLKGLNK